MMKIKDNKGAQTIHYTLLIVRHLMSLTLSCEMIFISFYGVLCYMDAHILQNLSAYRFQCFA